MARKKFLTASSSRERSEISLVYQSVTESTLGSGLARSLQGQYERIGNDCTISSSSSSSTTAANENRKGSKTLKLGGNSKEGRITRGRVRLQCLLKVPSNFIMKMKEQYATWKDGARRANIRVSDLFVANQVFMHVQASPVTYTRRKQHGLKPSVGFVNRVEAPSGSEREMRER